MLEILKAFDSFANFVHRDATPAEREALLSAFTAGVVSTCRYIIGSPMPSIKASGLLEEMVNFAESKAQDSISGN